MKEDDRRDGGGERRRHNQILRRYWEIVNLYPRIDDPELARRIEEFTMKATPEQMLTVQRAIFEAAKKYMSADPAWSKVMDHLDGKKVGLAIGEEYRTTVSLYDSEFHIEMGIEDESIPVLSVASRKDYVDALLRRKDIVRMLVTGRLKASHKWTLVRWGVAFHDLVKEDEFFTDLLSRKHVAQDAISEELARMDF
jgi:hypothetical protein